MQKGINKCNKQSLVDYAHSKLESEKFAGEYWGCNGGVYEMYPKEDTDAVIDELAGICQSKEYALWKSRAKVARIAASLWTTRNAFYKDDGKTKYDINGITDDSIYTNAYKTKRTINEWIDIWDNVEFVCECKLEHL